MKANSIVASSYLSFVAWLLPAGLSLLTPILLMRDVGVDGYGIYALLVSIALFFTVADLSLDAFLIPRIARKRANSAQVIAQAKRFFAIMALVVLVASGLCFQAFRLFDVFDLGRLTNPQLLLISVFTASQLLVTSSYIEASGTGMLNAYSWRTLYSNLGNIGAIASLHFFGLLSIETLLLCRVVTNLAIGTASMRFSPRSPAGQPPLLDSEALRFIKLALFGKFISIVTFNFDKIVIATYLTVRDVGIVSYPMQLGLALVMGASKLCLPLLPASAGSTDGSVLDGTVKSVVGILIVDVGIVVLLVSLWAPNLVPIIYGATVKESEVSFQFAAIVVGFWLLSLSAITANILPGWNRMGLNVLSGTVRACIIMTVMFVTIHFMGIFAVGLALILAGFWEISFLVWFLWRNDMRESARLAVLYLVLMLGAVAVVLPGKYVLLKQDALWTATASLVLLVVLVKSSLGVLRARK
jgi:O-antigen/teichoic acid export membrane protein